jgi:hypothetical protein
VGNFTNDVSENLNGVRKNAQTIPTKSALAIKIFKNNNMQDVTSIRVCWQSKPAHVAAPCLVRYRVGKFYTLCFQHRSCCRCSNYPTFQDDELL